MCCCMGFLLFPRTDRVFTSVFRGGFVVIRGEKTTCLWVLKDTPTFEDNSVIF